MTIQEIEQLFETEFHLTLSERQTFQFQGFAPHMLLAACKSTQRWQKKKELQGVVLSRSSIVASVLNTLVFRAGTPKPKPTVKTRSLADKAEDLRAVFQELVSSDNAWTITSLEAQEIVKSYGEDAAKKVFTGLGRYSENEQQMCLDKLEWELSLVNL